MPANSVFDSRSYYKPFTYPQFYEKYVIHEKAHWLPEEVPLIEDIKDWNKRLTNEEKTFLTQVFRFFTQADVDVASAYSTEYLPVFVLPEIRMMLLSFGAREAIHVQAYSHLIDTLGMPEATYQQFLDYKEMRDKHTYLVAHSHRKGGSSLRQLVKNIAVFSAFTEGMQLFSSFIMLLNFARAENGGKMKGMSQIVTWSILDETMHTLGMIDLFREIIKENPEVWDDELKGEIYQIARDMVDLEDKFIDLAFAGYPVANLTATDVKQYIRYIADRRLTMLGLKDNWGIEKNPLPWVEEMINAPIFTNFFEQRSTDYAKASLVGSWSDVFPSH